MSAVRPLRSASMAALRFCGVTPALRGFCRRRCPFPAPVASSSRSTVTKLSPAFSAIFSALSNSRAVAGGEIDLAGARARHLRHLAERLFDGRQRLARIAAGAVDQTRGQTLRIVEQDLEHVLGRELLMALAQGEGLRGLDETAGAVGVFLDIHHRSLGPKRRHPDDGPHLSVRQPRCKKQGAGPEGGWLDFHQRFQGRRRFVNEEQLSPA